MTKAPRSPSPSPTSTSATGSTSSRWYRSRAALGAACALVVLGASTTAVGLTKHDDASVQSAATSQDGPGALSTWDGPSPLPTHPVTKTVPTPSGSTTAHPGSSTTGSGGSGGSTSTSSATGSTSSTGGSGGGSGPGAGSWIPSGKTAFGASLDLANGGGFANALSTQDRRFGGLDVVRVFYNGFPAPWSSRPELSSRASVVSFKIPPSQVLSGSYDSKLAEWFRTAPRGADVYWTYWHEPENDSQINPAQYRAAWQHISRISRTADNPHLHATLILMGYTVHQGSGRDWHDWYPGSDAIDVMGWDVYNTGAKKDKYTDPATLYGPVAAVSRSIGKPWGIGETGSRLIPGDNGSQRAEWLLEAGRYLDSAGALWAAYWDVNAGGGSFKLTDAASLAAWRSFVSG